MVLCVICLISVLRRPMPAARGLGKRVSPRLEAAPTPVPACWETLIRPAGRLRQQDAYSPVAWVGKAVIRAGSFLRETKKCAADD